MAAPSFSSPPGLAAWCVALLAAHALTPSALGAPPGQTSRPTAPLPVGSGLPPATAPAALPESAPDALAAARAAFRVGACDQAVPPLLSVLYPSPRLAQTNDLIEAHLLLGACKLLLGDEGDARREFEEALFLDRATELDPLIFSREAVAFFRATRAALLEREQADAAKRALAEEKERLRKYRASLVFYERRSFATNFIPLGAPQFQNKQRGKGVSFFVGQAVFGATSIGVWAYLTRKYGRSREVPPGEAQDARALQQIGIASAVGFYALYAGSVVDGLLHYKPRVRVDADDSLLPEPEPAVAPRTTQGRRPSRTPRVFPVIGEDSLGVGLMWER